MRCSHAVHGERLCRVRCLGRRRKRGNARRRDCRSACIACLSVEGADALREDCRSPRDDEGKG
eukprot:scaffold3158_cov105-Pinguiococcus_pyrenoidosus.AAC.1